MIDDGSRGGKNPICFAAMNLQSLTKQFGISTLMHNRKYNHNPINHHQILMGKPKSSESKRRNQVVASVELGNTGKQRQYWLLKTEPGEWSWEDQAENGGISKWDGVKNKQAQKNLKAMKLEDLCFFYHSGVKQRRVVGVVSVVKEWYEEEGGGGVAVDVKQVGEMRRCLDLKEFKGEGGLRGFVLFRQPRLWVVPVEEAFWERVCKLGGGFEGDGRKDDDGGGGSSGAED